MSPTFAGLDRSGLAALSDLETECWKDHFRHLESVQDLLLARESDFRSTAYKWPRDPLHTWSRCWEYPYVYHHLRGRRTELGGAPLLLDVGSGVTFFPFACAELGYRVVCTDVDPVCAVDLPRAAKVMPLNMRSVEFRLTDGSALPLRDAEADALCCISVLEHIPRWSRTVEEMGRVLKPGGLLVLTVDLDLLGTAELSPSEHAKLQETLSERFEWLKPETTIHPVNILHSGAGPYPLTGPLGAARAWFYVKQYLIKPALGRKPIRVPGALHLAVHGMVLQRR